MGPPDMGLRVAQLASGCRVSVLASRAAFFGRININNLSRRHAALGCVGSSAARSITGMAGETSAKCPPQTLRLPPATCAGIQNVRVLGSGNGREAVEAHMPGISVTVVRKAASAGPCAGVLCDGVRFRTFETYREAALLFDLMAQYGPDSVRVHGLCENSTDGTSSIVMEKLNISGVDHLLTWRKQVGEDEVKLQLLRYAERLGNFKKLAR